MALKDMMEEKQLNFNQPLLSVRRGSSATAPPVTQKKAHNSRRTIPPLPYYKSDIKSGPIRNPGVVPFKWECIPGRPKDDNKAHIETLKSPTFAPKLPPGRITNHQNQRDEVLRNSPTSSSRYRAEMNNSHYLESTSPNKFLSENEDSEEEKGEKDSSSSEDENVTYTDAREMLSRSESFFNCSVSGVSGLDGPESSFSDPQTQDFMMGRFLPAAKAVASETPVFASRRQVVVREEEKRITQVVKLKKQSPQYNGHPDDGEDEEEDDEEEEEDEFDGQNFSVKLCGLMPRFCMLNPIPGIKDHVQAVSSVRSVRTRPGYAQSCRDKKLRDDSKTSRGDPKKSTHQYNPGPITESLSNGHLGRYGIPRQKNTSPRMFQDKKKQLLGLPGKPCEELEITTHNKSEDFTTLVKSTHEKTLYVDSERRVESRHSNSSTSESRGSNPSVDYSLDEIMSLCFVDEKAITTDSRAFSKSEKTFEKVIEGDSNSIVDIEKTMKPEVKTIELYKNGSTPLITLTPLLPKSPSESWLSRTLPSMSLRNPSSNPYLQNHAFRASPMDPKRERFLKKSNMQNMLLLITGDLAPISEN